jgi:hypothetical protein
MFCRKNDSEKRNTFKKYLNMYNFYIICAYKSPTAPRLAISGGFHFKFYQSSLHDIWLVE